MESLSPLGQSCHPPPPKQNPRYAAEYGYSHLQPANSIIMYVGLGFPARYTVHTGKRYIPLICFCLEYLYTG